MIDLILLLLVFVGMPFGAWLAETDLWLGVAITWGCLAINLAHMAGYLEGRKDGARWGRERPKDG